MNTDISAIEDQTDDIPATQKKPRRAGFALALLAFIFALAALVGTVWMWWQDEMAGEQGDDRIFAEITRLENADSEFSVKLKHVQVGLESLADNDDSAQIAALHKRLETNGAQLASVDQSIRDQLSLLRSLQAATESMQGRLLAVEAALAAMSSPKLDAGGELDLAEVDYLLRLANERLRLFSDPVTADRALEIADRHLAAMNKPMYLGVRKEIATARGALAAINAPDYVGIASQLDAIREFTALLPFRGSAPVNQESESEVETGWWEKVKSVFSSLVTIRHSTAQENARISLEDKDYIRQRLWMQLEIAHLSLMRREQGAFRNSLERARETLSTWFDSGDSAYQSAMSAMDELLALEIELDVPDISAPWATIRLVREGRSRLAPVPSALAPVEPAVDLPEEQQELEEVP
ncbi:MAG: uroporphyrinogen-III C-methyltransferase [Xanthomonadales bacterium]